MSQAANQIKYGYRKIKDNGIEIYSTHNEGKFVAAKRCIRTTKNKIYKISKNMFIKKLDDIVFKYGNMYIIAQLK